MAIGAPTHSDEDSELSDLDGDDTIGFDRISRTPREREGARGLATLGAGLTRGSGDGDAESFGGDVADPSVAAAPDFGAALCEAPVPRPPARSARRSVPTDLSSRSGARAQRPRARRHHRPSLRPLQHRETRRPGRAPRRRHRRSFPPRRRGRRRQPRPNRRKTFAMTSAGRVFHWHATSGASLGDPIVETHNQTFALDVRADGRAFATAGVATVVRTTGEDSALRRPLRRPDASTAALIASSRCVTWTMPRT